MPDGYPSRNHVGPDHVVFSKLDSIRSMLLSNWGSVFVDPVPLTRNYYNNWYEKNCANVEFKL